jgi:ABC-2 type transport system ATP-binding protein
VLAVDRMDLRAMPGEVTALVGPKGAGKTTLMLMLAALLTPDEGEIRIAGIDPVAAPREVRATMGWVPARLGTWDALTGREILELVAAAYRMAPRLARVRAAETLDLVHLGNEADRPARELSQGQKLRLALGRALVHHPSVLLLDQPASGLDPGSRIELWDILRQVTTPGGTVLVSSPTLSELQEIAERAVLVSRGRTVAVQDLTDSGSAQLVSRWRITTLDQPALIAALNHRGVAVQPVGDAVDVDVAGDLAASDLLTQLVRDGIPITTFVPSPSAIETPYQSATEDRQ